MTVLAVVGVVAVVVGIGAVVYLVLALVRPERF